MLLVLLVAATAAGSKPKPRPIAASHPPILLGLDHVPLAVSDLDAAAARFRALGFTLKPGRPHDNGIRNQHIKFEDGTEIELITAPQARDPLTAEYRRHLAAGDGPAFVAFYAPETNRLLMQLRVLRRPYHQDGALVSFPETDPLRYIFFGPRNHSPTDRPEHFRHSNSAQSLIAVWLAGVDRSAEQTLLTSLGAQPTVKPIEVFVPSRTAAIVLRLREGEVYLLPVTYQRAAGRRIVGVTLRVNQLEAVRRALDPALLAQTIHIDRSDGSSLLLPPALTHGLWIELRAPPE